jgi:hypothetical protein
MNSQADIEQLSNRNGITAFDAIDEVRTAHVGLTWGWGNDDVAIVASGATRYPALTAFFWCHGGSLQTTSVESTW